MNEWWLWIKTSKFLSLKFKAEDHFNTCSPDKTPVASENSQTEVTITKDNRMRLARPQGLNGFFEKVGWAVQEDVSDRTQFQKGAEADSFPSHLSPDLVLAAPVFGHGDPEAALRAKYLLAPC